MAGVLGLSLLGDALRNIQPPQVGYSILEGCQRFGFTTNGLQKIVTSSLGRALLMAALSPRSCPTIVLRPRSTG